jgi:methionine sulfoxide reductase heme-binding subunit
MRKLSPQHIQYIKVVVFVLCLLPAALLAWRFFHDDLGANPIEAITRGTGDWLLRFLLITLAVTPLRKLTQWHWLLRLRRMLGLYAFFYGVLHLITYLWLDQFFDWAGIVKDIWKRPFITVGFAAFLLMIPLAVTSANAMIRLLGGKRWQALHRSVYAVGVLGVLHYWWLVKRDLREPLIYAIVLAILLAARLLSNKASAQKQGA